MEQNLNNLDSKDKTLNFFKENKKKLLILLSILLTFSFSYFAYDVYKDEKNSLISQKYIQAGLLFTSNNKEESRKIYEEIILSKNKFYSILALNIILEKNLETRKEKVLEYFRIVEKSNKSSNQNDLILFKKALYLIKYSSIDQGKQILNKLIKSNSNLKPLAEEILNKK